MVVRELPGASFSWDYLTSNDYNGWDKFVGTVIYRIVQPVFLRIAYFSCSFRSARPRRRSLLGERFVSNACRDMLFYSIP